MWNDTFYIFDNYDCDEYCDVTKCEECQFKYTTDCELEHIETAFLLTKDFVGYRIIFNVKTKELLNIKIYKNDIPPDSNCLKLMGKKRGYQVKNDSIEIKMRGSKLVLKEIKI